MAPSPIFNHQMLATEILFSLRKSIDECFECVVIMEEDWKVYEYTVLKPDISFICGQRGGKYITKTPEIIVEIISPSTAKRDEKYKLEIYEQEKVKYYILVYPNDLKAKIYKLQNGKFKKVADFLDGIYQFKNIKCKPLLNFKNIFKRFAKNNR